MRIQLHKDWDIEAGLPGQDIQERTAKIGHSGQNIQDRTSMRGHPGQDIQDRTSGTGQPGLDRQFRVGRTVGIVLSGQDREDRIARTGTRHPGQDSPDRTAETGHSEQDSLDRYTCRSDQAGQLGMFSLIRAARTVRPGMLRLTGQTGQIRTDRKSHQGQVSREQFSLDRPD
jgi:hypothetical protein